LFVIVACLTEDLLDDGLGDVDYVVVLLLFDVGLSVIA
jgi:hypothetical protein